MMVSALTSILLVSLGRSLTEPVEKMTHLSRGQSAARVTNTEYQVDVFADGVFSY
jgi:hypothetical protein